MHGTLLHYDNLSQLIQEIQGLYKFGSGPTLSQIRVFERAESRCNFFLKRGSTKIKRILSPVKHGQNVYKSEALNLNGERIKGKGEK